MVYDAHNKYTEKNGRYELIDTRSKREREKVQRMSEKERCTYPCDVRELQLQPDQLAKYTILRQAKSRRNTDTTTTTAPLKEERKKKQSETNEITPKNTDQ